MNTQTKKLVKKGFSLMELLIVMVILAGLATMIIPNMDSSTEAAKMTSMRNDARNTISLLQAKYIDEQDYNNVFTAGDFVDENDNGLATELLEDESPVPVSKGNTITLAQVSTAKCPSGFSIVVSNPAVPTKTIVYNSCTSGKISTAEVSSGS